MSWGQLAAAGGGLSIAGITYFLKSNSESVIQDVKDLALLGGLRRTMTTIAASPVYSATQMFDEVVSRFANRTAAVYADDSGIGTSFTWKEMDILSNQVANWGLGLGLQCGDNVVLLMDNRPEYVIFWLGMAKIGVRSALINTNLVGGPLKHCLAIANAKAYILGREHTVNCATLRQELGGNHWYSSTSLKTLVTHSKDPHHADPLPPGIEEIDYLILSRNKSRPAIPAVKPTDPLLYIYTSGTTGLPKAASVSSMRYASAAYGFKTAYSINENDRIYCTLPLYHSAGGMLGVGMSWTSGAALIIRRKFSARNFWRDISLYDCSVIQYIGELCRYLTLHPPSEYDRKHKVRVAVGNGLRPDVWSKFQERFNIPAIGEFYGATEGNCALLNLRNKFGSIGNLPVWVSKLGIAPFYLYKFDVENETVIRDANGRCIRCQPNEIGEMLGKIDPDRNPLSRFDGYSNKEATEKKILRNVEAEGDQWFRTGDLLYFDQAGNYYFVDRIGDTFRWKGENVSTNEVAEVLAGVKGIAEANVYGVAIPHNEGRGCMAAIVVNSEFDFKECYKYVKNNLPSYARPIFLRLTPAMDITGTFKHQKVEFRNQGFDPSKTKDPIYVVDTHAETYVPLDAKHFEDICNNKLKSKL